MMQKYSKSYYRNLYLRKREQLSSNERIDFSNEIARRAIEFLKPFDTIHTFLPIDSSLEVNTWLIAKNLLQTEKKVVTSITFPKGKLDHSIITEETIFKNGLFDTPVPYPKIKIDINRIDVVIIPLLISDQKGNRIGYGGGYYDRFLSSLNSNCLKIGLCFFEPIEIPEIFEDHDISLNYLITPYKAHNF